jgi:EAL domain-containing protein (putative c-di-GMP-specific phosphodiesterase class I)
LDDFGTGYSSLSILHRAPIDALKIDRAFVQRLNGGGQDESTIVRAIMLLARELRMDVIAEGIETARQAAYLKTLDCNYGQGYWFCKPLDAEGVTAILGKKSMGA